MDPKDITKMEQLLLRQQALGSEIENLVKNFKKTALDRRNLAFYERRLQLIGEYAKEFRENDEWLQTVIATQRTSTYFTNNYAQQIGRLIDEYSKVFKEGIQSQAPQLEELFQKQSELAQKIDKIIGNEEKTPPNQKTKAIFDGWIKDIEKLFAEMSTNNGVIVFLTGTNQSHEYFVQNKFENMSAKTRKCIALYKEKAAQLVEVALPDPNKEKQNQPIPNINLIKRQQAMIASLQRFIKAKVPEDAAAPSLKAKEKLWEQIQQLHFEIFEVMDDPIGKGYDLDLYIELEEKVMELLASVKPTTAPFNITTPPTLNVPLPKINIPKFDGEYGKWHTFSDLFKKVVHEQPISAAQKFWYLKTVLSGEAERLIKHLALTERNYAAAWDLLNDRYDNKRVLTATLVQQLVEYSNVTSDAKSIKSFHDLIQENLSALRNVDLDVDSWDPILLQILVKKLDRHTHVLYESQIKNPRELQSMKDFLKFLEQRFQALESLGNKEKGKSHENQGGAKPKATSATVTSSQCRFCAEKGHAIYYCKKFIEMKPKERLNWVTKQRLCPKCIKAEHSAQSCKTRSCPRCKRNHNSLLHLDKQDNTAKGQSSENSKPSTTIAVSDASTHVENKTPNDVAASLTASIPTEPKKSYGLLGTAIIYLENRKGQQIEFRALLDSCSQINIITERAARKLGINQAAGSIDVSGVGLSSNSTNKQVRTRLSSKNNDFNASLLAYTMPAIVTNQPSVNFNINSWPIPKEIPLADPEFHAPGPIDVLIGVELYHDIVQTKVIRMGKDLPVLEKTVFGYVVTGRIGESVLTCAPTCAVLTNKVELDLKKFWELEEVQEETKCLTVEEQLCEEYFNRSVSRNKDGRFIVKLPFKDEPQRLGLSEEMAKQRFLAVVRRLNANPQLKRDYAAFMQEYLELGHMTEIEHNSIKHPAYFLPHHGVIRPESTTTKLRVVFDASAATSRKISLNDVLSTGPTIQDDLFSILTRFRLPKFVFTADIEKMYRQILVHQSDRRYQLIFWRNNDQEPLKTFQLNTVTYGTTSAPYLAMKCLQRLAQLEENNHSVGAEIVQKNFYVDDVMTGFNTLSEALHARDDLVRLLQKGGFKLRKWCANHPKILESMDSTDVAIKLDFNTMDSSNIKTLGQVWSPTSDEFQIKINVVDHGNCTKRTVSSDISRIFDPLGLLGPVTVEAKLFLQHLWERKLDWDEPLPSELADKWTQYMDSLSCLNGIKVQRHMFASEVPNHIQLHGFADASERAYGGVIYLRSTTPSGRVIVRLLCAKSRLAPMKRLTIPKLELCAAVLTARLAARAKKCIQLPDVATTLWSDSEIVLSWINASSSSYYAFVANRISIIQGISEKTQWRHVGTKDNPADMLSRGIAANKLGNQNIWFYGPMFLHGSESKWPAPFTPKAQCKEEQKRTVMTTTSTACQPQFLKAINHSNSFNKLQRIVAYVLRFAYRASPLQTDGINLSIEEIARSRKFIIKTMQQEEFKEEIKLLSHGTEVHKTSPLKGLAPFIDDQGLIRVGGRLQASSLKTDTKHPILLPDHPLTRVLMEETHIKNKHVGAQGLIAIMRQQYWPLKAKILARMVIHRCIICTKAKPKLMQQIMGNLPTDRVEPARPFINTGVDFWGPIWTHYKLRGKRPTKSYVAVFCCFASKAIHMEVVTDLTTDAFLMALKRFIGRRGICRKIYCDNATNFVGAKNELQELKDAIFNSKSQERLKTVCSFYNIEFVFMPARAPHFGGLWEAAVKSAKNLFKKSAASASFTYEELETFVIEIEAILNSRPLTQNSSDPNDFAAITAGNLLTGDPLTATVDPDAQPLQLSLKKRWGRIMNLKDEFWNRWRSEYLADLQQRVKWRSKENNIQIGQLVLIHEDNSPSMQWPMGRIVETFPGPDGQIRVVNVRTHNGILKRAIHRLAPLPIDPKDDDATNQQENEPSPAQNNTSTTKHSSLPVSIPLTRSRKAETSNEVPNKRPSLASNLLLTLVALFLLPLALCSPINMTSFHQQPGLYVEQISDIKMSTSSWNLIVYFELNPFKQELEMLSNCTTNLHELYRQTTNDTTCSSLALYVERPQRMQTTTMRVLINSHYRKINPLLLTPLQPAVVPTN